jgi:hypothetical protein
MATTGCCDLMRNMGDSRSTDDGDLPIINGNNIPTSPTIEYPKALAISVSSGPSSIIHRSRGHKRTKSAGNNSLRDFSLYTATGLYAHQPRNKANLRLYSSSNLPIKTSSELNIYELLASNHYKNSVEINSGQLNIEQQQQQNGLIINTFHYSNH